MLYGLSDFVSMPTARTVSYGGKSHSRGLVRRRPPPTPGGGPQAGSLRAWLPLLTEDLRPVSGGLLSPWSTGAQQPSWEKWEGGLTSCNLAGRVMRQALLSGQLPAPGPPGW